MKIVTTVITERKGEVYLSEHDLADIINKALKGYAPEITTDNLDWDITQGSLMNGVKVSWAESEEPTETEREI